MQSFSIICHTSSYVEYLILNYGIFLQYLFYINANFIRVTYKLPIALEGGSASAYASVRAEGRVLQRTHV
jgi:hypothetical protein